MRQSKIADVLSGAKVVFLRCGFEGANVDVIAEESKVSKATLYAHFPSKNMLFLSVVQAECDRLSAEISRPLSSGDEPRVVLEELSRRMIGLVMDNDYIRLLRACIGAVAVLPEAGEIYMEAGPRRATRIVGQVLQGLHEAGSLKVHDAQSAASQFIHLSVSGVIMPRMLAVDQPIDAVEHSKRAVDAGAYAVYPSPELNRPDGTEVTMRKHSVEPRNASLKILEAARALAAREGAGKITIEAVAKEAGLSKGGVLYNFSTKKALLSGLLDQMLVAHRQLLEKVPERYPSRTLRGHLETVLQSQDLDDDLSMAILAASASDPRLLDPLRTELTCDLERILSDAKRSPDAMIAVLAIQGLRFQMLLNLPDGGADIREGVIERLRTIIDELE
ncbi:TetR family transcriptional regulator [Roseovarius sp. PS-C2]|uniref:TetR family transcriptional regulator n=2 Tax=Rhodobacterales TaxID=204455 RepID=UPI00209B762E|nr:TetR family transcriptional regulator [Roseovarius sp. PS-C2]